MSENAVTIEDVTSKLNYYTATVKVTEKAYDTIRNRQCSMLEIQLQPNEIVPIPKGHTEDFAWNLQRLLTSLDCAHAGVSMQFQDEYGPTEIILRTDRANLKNLQEIAGAIQIAALEQPFP